MALPTVTEEHNQSEQWVDNAEFSMMAKEEMCLPKGKLGKPK